MKNLKQVVIAVATTSVLSLSMFVHAGESSNCEHPGFHHHFKTDDGVGGGHGRDSKRPGRIPFKLLDLTDTQKQTLESARAAREPAVREAHEKLRAAREALDKAGDQNADDATLNKLSGDLASLIAEQEVSRIKAHRDFLNILTPEQQEKLKAFGAERGERTHWKDKRKNSPAKDVTKN